MSQPIDGEVSIEHLGLTVQMTSAQLHLLAEAGERCGMGPADYMLAAALASARTIVPTVCQPAAADADARLPGLFSEASDE